MGNFNMLCGASQQVIQEDDRCFLLPIVQQSAYSPISLTFKGKSLDVPGVSKYQCYPDSQWTWLGNFLEAKYNDRCEFDLLDTASNRVRLFILVYKLMEKSAVARESESDASEVFDINSYLFDEHVELYKALVAAKPTEESDWRIIVPQNLADHFASLSEVLQYLYMGTITSKVYVATSSQPLTMSAMQFAVYHGVVFDKLVAQGAAEKGAVEEFFEKALPQSEPSRPGGRIAALKEALETGFVGLPEDTPGVQEMQKFLVQDMYWAVEKLTRAIQQALYYASHGEHGEAEEILHGADLGNASAETVGASLLAACTPVIEARFALNAMGREHLHIAPLRTCGDEGNCYGEEYAKFIEEASAAVTLARPVRW